MMRRSVHTQRMTTPSDAASRDSEHVTHAARPWASDRMMDCGSLFMGTTAHGSAQRRPLDCVVAFCSLRRPMSHDQAAALSYAIIAR